MSTEQVQGRIQWTRFACPSEKGKWVKGYLSLRIHFGGPMFCQIGQSSVSESLL